MDAKFEEQRFTTTKRVTLITAVVNSLLALLKIIFGLLGHSHALFADGLHSLGDLVSDGLVLIAARYGSMTRDRDHPYGHGKIETLGTAVLSLVLVAVAVGIVYDAIRELLVSDREIPDAIVLVIAAISVICNEIIFQYSKRRAEAIGSDLLLANAWHHRSDALSSIVVLLGVAGSMWGFYYLDALAAIIVAIMISHMAWDLIWDSLRELIDTAVAPWQVEKISHIIRAVPGVEQLHECRTRTMRGYIIVDVHVIVGSMLSVSEGHHIASHVRLALQNNIPKIADVTVHIDPEDDEKYPPSLHLPNRRELLKLLQPHLATCLGANQMKLTIHYLAGKLNLIFELPISLLNDHSVQEIQSQYQTLQVAHLDIHSIRVTFFPEAH